jgi:hypothetical protein
MLKVSEGGCIEHIFIGPGRLVDCIYRLFGFILMMICGVHSILHPWERFSVKT